jgi:hypothetical protein
MERDQIEAQLISTFFDTAGSFPVHAGCEGMMRTLIHDSVELMVKRGKTASKSIEKANDTVRAFTLEMKEEARKQGLDSIGENTYGPVHSRLQAGERQGWWPFTEKP